MTKQQQNNLLTLISNSYCNKVVRLFGGLPNSDVCAFGATPKGDINWAVFVEQHKEKLVPEFLASNYCTTTLARKWSEVGRNKRPEIRKELSDKLDAQLGYKNLVDEVLRKFHLSEILKISGIEVRTHARQGGRARRGGDEQSSKQCLHHTRWCTLLQAQCYCQTNLSA